MANEGYEVGYVMADGTVFAGISPDNGKAMYVMPNDLSNIFNGNLENKLESAAENETKRSVYGYISRLDNVDKYISQLNHEGYEGHDDWVLPDRSELNILFNNQMKIGDFGFADWYLSVDKQWSSKYKPRLPWVQRFSDGIGRDGGFIINDPEVSIRLIRYDPNPECRR